MKVKSNNQHTCDICNELIKKWDIMIIRGTWYYPGEKHDSISSDICNKSEKLIELCPTCYGKIKDIFEQIKSKGEKI